MQRLHRFYTLAAIFTALHHYEEDTGKTVHFLWNRHKMLSYPCDDFPERPFIFGEGAPILMTAQQEDPRFCDLIGGFVATTVCVLDAGLFQTYSPVPLEIENYLSARTTLMLKFLTDYNPSYFQTDQLPTV